MASASIKSAVLAVAATLMIGVLSVAGAPGAQAAAWTQDAPGVDDVKVGKAANPSSMGSVTVTAATNTAKPVPAVDNNGLYGIPAANPANIFAISTTTGASSIQFAVRNSNAVEMSTMAVDSGVKGRRAGFYTWYWGAGAGAGGAASNAKPVYFWAEGDTKPSDVYYMPLPSYFNHGGGNPYYSGGVVNQNTGMLYFGQGECDSISGSARFAIMDPATSTTYWSGTLQPATPSDNLWTGGNNCGGTPGYIASGAAVLPNGDFVLVVNGTSKAIAANDPINTRGQNVPVGTSVSFLVTVHPSMNNQPWKYSVMKMIAPAPGSTVSGFFGLHHYGTAFSNGYLYVVTDGNLHEINPLTGYIKLVGGTGTQMYDLGSSQTAAAITGTVRNDSTASGEYDAEAAGVPGVTVAIYESGGLSRYAQPTLLGTSVTNGEGQYTFIVPDSDPTGNTKYLVRLVQPTINGVAAVHTAGAASSTTEAGATNDAKLNCVDGNTYEGDGAGTVLSGECSSVKADGTSTSPALEALGATGDPKTWGNYGEVVMRNTWSESTIDFSISTAKTSTGDAAAGPATIDNGAPVHNNSAGATLWLGDAQGANTTKTDNAAHNDTDDGVYIDSYAGKVPLQDTVLAASKTYALAADVSGDLASQAQVKGWVTGAGNNTWNTTAKWNPTVSNSVAKGDFQFQTGAISGSPTVQMRVNASTTAATAPTNSAKEYQGGTVNWTTPGEIEDYSFTVQDSVWRPAAVTTGPTGTFTIGGKSLTANATPKIGSAVGAPANQPVTVTATAPNANWTLVSALVKDTVTGETKYTTTPTTNGLSSTVTWTPALGDDVTVEFKYAKAPDPAKSTVTIDKNQAPVGDYITATATVKDADGALLSGIEVSFGNKSDPTTTLSAPTCTTAANGTCQVTITSATAGDYAEELSATVLVGGTPARISGSPRDVTFVAGKADPNKSSLSFSPASPLKVGNEAANTYTFTALVQDSANNKVPGQTVSFVVTKADGSAVNPASTYLSASTCPTGDGTGTTKAGQCSVTLWSTEAGTFKVSAKLPDPANGVLTEVGAGSPATVAFVPEAPKPGPFTCSDGNGGTKPGSSLKVAPASLPVADDSSITAYVTDKYCNPVPNAPVTFAIDSATAILSPTSAVTDAAGLAYSSVTDTKAEIVSVGASTPVNGNPAAVDAPKSVEFKSTGFSWTTSSFTVSPAANASDTTKTNWRTANGTDAYTVTLTARDAQNNLLGGLDKTKMAFQAPATVSVSAVQEISTGVYQATMTSRVASAAPTASVAYDSQPVKNSAGGTASPIPFKTGDPVPGPKTCDDGNGGTKPGSSLTVSPTELSVRADATVRAYVTDEFCNPVADALVSFAVDGSATLSSASRLTGSDGLATVTVTDNTAETVKVVAKTPMNGVPTAIDASKDVRFVVGGFSWEKSSFAVSPAVSASDTAKTNWRTADGVESYTVTLTAKDSNDNPLTSLDTSAMAFTASSASVSVSAVANIGGGQYQATVTSKKAAADPTASVSYNSQAVKTTTGATSAPVPFKAGPVDPAPKTCEDGRPGSSFTVNPAETAVGGNATARAYVTDANCNPVENELVSFTVDGSATVNPASRLTGADGVATAIVTDNTAETVNVVAKITVNGVAKTVDQAKKVKFSLGSFSWEKSSFAVSPAVSASDAAKTNWRTADGVDAYTVTLTAKDDADHALTGLDVAAMIFAVSSSDVSVSAVTEIGAGQYQAKVTSKTASAVPTVSVSYNSVDVKNAAGTTASPVPFKAGQPATGPITCPDGRTGSNLTVNPAEAKVGGSSTVTATVTDENCNPIPGATVNFTADGSSTLTQASVATGADGKATTTLRDNKAEVVNVAATATANGGTSAVDKAKQVTFTAGSADPTKSHVVVGPPDTQPAGSPVVVTVTVRDSSDNPIANLKASDFALTGTADDLPDLAFTNFAPGPNGTYTFKTTSKLAGTFQVRATVQSVLLNDAPTATFEARDICVSNCDSIDNPYTEEDESKRQTRIVMVDNDQWADGFTKDTARAYAYDMYGNPVAGAVFTITDVSTGQLAGILTPAVQTITTGADGTAMAEWTSHKADVFTAVTTVKSGNLSQGVPVGNSNLNAIRFSTGHASAGTSVLSVSPTTALPVGQSFTATATIVDGAGNPLAGETVSFYVEDPTVTLSARTCQTLPNGKCSVTVSSKLAGDYLVHATISEYGKPTDIGYALPLTASPRTVSFYATTVCVEGVDECDPVDDPQTEVDEAKENFTHVEIVTNNASADGTDRNAVAVHAYDKYGNPVKDAAVRITTSDAMLNLLTTSGVTNAQGVAYFEATSTVAGGHVASVTVAGKGPKGSPTTLNFTTGTVSNVALTISPVSTLPVGSSFTVTARVTDATGNGLDKAVVSYLLPSGLKTPGGATVATCTTSDNGECVIQVTSTKTGSYAVTGKVGAVESNSVTARFTAGAPSAENSTVAVTRDGAAFDGQDRDIVTVTVRDQYGNPVADAEVSSTPVAGQSSGLAVQGDVHPTGPDGKTTIWYTSTQAGAKQADVRIDGTLVPSGSPATVRFGNGAGDPERSSWTLNPATALTVGTGRDSQFTLEATVRDVFDDPVSGAVVTFEADQATTAWGDQSRTCVTDAQGKCSVTVSSTKAGTFAFTAGMAAGQIGQAKAAVWTPDAVCGSCSKVVVTTDNAIADGADADVATVQAVDQYGNPVPGQLVISIAGDDTLLVGSGIPFTDVNGRTTIAYSSTKAGPHTATVSIGTDRVAPEGSPVTLNFKAGGQQEGPFTCSDGRQGTSLTVSPASLAVGGSASAVALVTDKNCNPVPGVEVTFAADGSAGVSPVTVVTGADGKAQAQVSDTVAETVKVSGSFPVDGAPAKVDEPKPVTFTSSEPSPNPTGCADGKVGTNVSVAPARVVIPATSKATAYVTDAFCNPVGPGVAVTFTVSGSGRLSAVTVVTDADSRAVVTVSDAKPETVGVTAKLGTAVVAGSPARVTFIDETAPEAPVIDSPKGGDLTNDDPLVVGGHGEPGAVVEVTDGGEVVCQAVVSADGTWSCTVSLEDGDHKLEATQTDPSGNKSDPCDPITVVVDTESPSAEIKSADKDEITGTADPDSTVTVNYPKKDGTTGTVVVPVDPDGTWSVPTPDDAASGKIEVWATDPAGNVSSKDEAQIDLDAPGAPTIESANEEGITGKADPSTTEPGDSVLVKDKDGNVICSTTVQDDMTWSCSIPPELGHSVDGPITAVVVDPAGNESEPGNGVLDTQAPDAPVVTSPAPGKEINDPTPEVTGTGEPGATVTVKDGDDNVLCTAVVDAAGKWSCTVGKEHELEDGPSTLVVTQTDPNGNVSEEVVIEIVVDTVPPNVPVVDGGNSGTITGTVPGPVDPGTIVTVTDPDGEVLCATTVEADGSWTCLVPDSVTDDTTITVVATDPAGNTSDPVTYPLDVTPPGQPTVDSANSNEVTGSVPGVVDPGTIVIVTWPDGSVDEVVVGPDGKWSVTTPEGMEEGEIHVVAKDPSGNVSKETVVDLDVTPPTAPVVNPSTGSEITGSGEPGGTASVTGPDGQPVPGCEQVSIDSDGRFSCRPTTPLSPGDEITVTVTDPAGNVSEPTVVTIGRLAILVAYPELHRLGTQVVTGENFTAGENVCLYVYSTPMKVGCADADSLGKVTVSFVVPSSLEIGTHVVELQGERSGKIASSFEVIDIPEARTGGVVLGLGVGTGGGAGTAVLPGLIASLTLGVAGVWVYPKLRRQS